MGLVKRRGSAAKKTNMSDEQFEAIHLRFLSGLAQKAHDNQVPPQLIINWDQTRLNVVPSAMWTIEEEGSKWVEIASLNGKCQIIATFVVAMTGDLLPLQILYWGNTTCCQPSYTFPQEFDISHTKLWASGETSLRLVPNVIIPYISTVRERMELTDNHLAIVIYEAFSGHQTHESLQLLADNHILSVRIPSNCTDWLQPLDVSVNKAVKNHLHKSFNTWYAEQAIEAVRLTWGCQSWSHLKPNGLSHAVTIFQVTSRLASVDSRSQESYCRCFAEWASNRNSSNWWWPIWGT